MPVVLVLPAEDGVGGDESSVGDASASAPGDGKFYRVDSAHCDGPRLAMFRLGRNRLALPEQATDDRLLVTERLAELADSFDLSEPFQRIRDAIGEAQQAVR